MPDLPTVVFMGTPEFAKIILQTLHQAHFAILAVVAQPDKPFGRGENMASPPVAEFAKAHNLPLLQPENIRDPHVLAILQKLNPDFLLVAAYGKILPQAVLQTPKIACINVHASLLPKYRGAAPIQRALLNDDAKTGVAIMQMVASLDAGPVYAEKSLEILAADTTPILTEKLAALGGELLLEVLPKIHAGSLKPVAQDQTQVSYATKITKEMSRIDWTQSARQIQNCVRAFLPWPVADTFTSEQKRLRIFAAQALNTKSLAEPGTIVHIAPQGITVATGINDLLLLTCQAEGKKRMPAFAVANGLRCKVGDRFL